MYQRSSYNITNTSRIIAPLDSVGRGGHPKRRNHHRIITPVRSPKNLPGIGEPAVRQRNQVGLDVRVRLRDTVLYHLSGDSSLSTDAGPRDCHQRSSGSTTGWLLTKLRSPEGSTTQYQPDGAQSWTWPLGSSRSPPPSRRRGCGIGIVDVEKKMLNYENKINKHNKQNLA